MKDARSCTGCQHHIGAGLCRMNLERECGEGGHEAWEPRAARRYGREEFVDAAVSCGWGNKAAACKAGALRGRRPQTDYNRRAQYGAHDQALPRLQRARRVKGASHDKATG